MTVWVRTCLYERVLRPIGFPAQFAAGQIAAVHIRIAAPTNPAAVLPANIAIKVSVPARGETKGEISKDAASPFNQSAFNQMVTQIVEGTAATPVPPNAAQTVKPPSKTGAAPGDRKPDQLPDTPAADEAAPVKLTDLAVVAAAPVSGRKQETRGPAPPENDKPGQPVSMPVDVAVPIPIAPPMAPKAQLPSFADAGSAEPKPIRTAIVSDAKEPAVVAIQAKPILEVRIHLNQPVSETSVPRTQTAPAVSTLIVTPAVASLATPAVAQVVAIAAPVVAPVAARVLSLASAGTAPVAATAAVLNGAAPAATQPVPNGQTMQQDPKRGAADSEDADKSPVAEAGVHKASRTTRIPESPVAVSQATREAGPAQLPSQNSTAPPASQALVQASTIGREEKAEARTISAPPKEETTIDQPKTQQPIRSLALEFAPEGAGDIRVRLSERAGDVHISLHGTDPSLAGRVREGVGDLVGSLSRAGYDAEAWTPGQHREGRREQPDQRKTFHRTPGDEEEFSGMLQQPIQEIS